MSDSAPMQADRPVKEGLVGQGGRFLLLGGANTFVTSLGFYALSFVVRPAIAYTLVYVAGLLFVTLTTPRLVFGTSPGHRRKLALASMYFGVYLCGLAAVQVLTHELSAPRPLVIVGTLAVTTPLNFVGARWLVGPRALPDQR